MDKELQKLKRQIIAEDFDDESKIRKLLALKKRVKPKLKEVVQPPKIPTQTHRKVRGEERNKGNCVSCGRPATYNCPKYPFYDTCGAPLCNGCTCMCI